MWVEPVIGLSGQLGSGKSSLAMILAERNSWPRAAFGDYLRHMATERGLGTDRTSLQQLGEEQIALGWDDFCCEVLNYSGWKPGSGLVVDGIRHVEAIRSLNRLMYPQSMFHVHLAITEELRQNRLVSRDGIQVVLGNQEDHSTEAQVMDALPHAADMLVDAARSAEQLADDIMEAVLAQESSRKVRQLLANMHSQVSMTSAMKRSELN